MCLDHLDLLWLLIGPFSVCSAFHFSVLLYVTSCGLPENVLELNFDLSVVFLSASLCVSFFFLN